MNYSVVIAAIVFGLFYFVSNTAIHKASTIDNVYFINLWTGKVTVCGKGPRCISNVPVRRIQ